LGTGARWVTVRDRERKKKTRASEVGNDEGQEEEEECAGE
jgi:hypothetical protein